MRRHLRLGLCLLALAGCGEDDFCGDLVERDGECMCPIGTTPIGPMACALPDGGIIAEPGVDASVPAPDAGADASLPDAGFDAGADSGVDACAPTTLYRDADDDGRGDPAVTMEARPMEGWVTDATDCDDDCPSCFEGGTEACDGNDNDCDGLFDEGLLEVRRDVTLTEMGGAQRPAIAAWSEGFVVAYDEIVFGGDHVFHYVILDRRGQRVRGRPVPFTEAEATEQFPALLVTGEGAREQAVLGWWESADVRLQSVPLDGSPPSRILEMDTRERDVYRPFLAATRDGVFAAVTLSDQVSAQTLDVEDWELGSPVSLYSRVGTRPPFTAWETNGVAVAANDARPEFFVLSGDQRDGEALDAVYVAEGRIEERPSTSTPELLVAGDYAALGPRGTVTPDGHLVLSFSDADFGASAYRIVRVAVSPSGSVSDPSPLESDVVAAFASEAPNAAFAYGRDDEIRWEQLDPASGRSSSVSTSGRSPFATLASAMSENVVAIVSAPSPAAEPAPVELLLLACE